MIFFWTQRDKGSSPSYSDGNLREKKEAPLTQKEDGSNEPETQNGETYKEEVPEDPGEYPINTYNYDDIKKTDDPEKKPPPVSHEPGQRVNIEELVREGKITIFDFYSEYCGPCVIMSPKLEKLEQKRDDIVVVKIDVNREGVRGIDWRSPVVAQYGIRSIPYFIVYNEAGRRTHAGRSASRKVYELLYREGIR